MTRWLVVVEMYDEGALRTLKSLLSEMWAKNVAEILYLRKIKG